MQKHNLKTAGWAISAALLTILVVSLLGIGPSVPSEQERLDQEVAESKARYEKARADTAAAQAAVDGIDYHINWLLRARAENPMKADRLLAQCEAETGAAAEGYGALTLSRCIQEKW